MSCLVYVYLGVRKVMHCIDPNWQLTLACNNVCHCTCTNCDTSMATVHCTSSRQWAVVFVRFFQKGLTEMLTLMTCTSSASVSTIGSSTTRGWASSVGACSSSSTSFNQVMQNVSDGMTLAYVVILLCHIWLQRMLGPCTAMFWLRMPRPNRIYHVFCSGTWCIRHMMSAIHLPFEDDIPITWHKITYLPFNTWLTSNIC